MEKSVTVKVNPSFNLEEFSNQLADMYRARGYSVDVTLFKSSSIIIFDKNTGGVNMVLGMGEGIKATCTYDDEKLIINFSDGDWTGKFVGFAVGWFLCLIPLFTAIAGTVKQTSLPKKISNDAAVIAVNL